MTRTRHKSISALYLVPALLTSLLLAACGGGGNSSSASTTLPSQEVSAPQATGNTATDGFNWLNFRRQQLGLSTLSRNTYVDAAAQGHSTYQGLNDTITHKEIVGNAGFTGVNVGPLPHVSDTDRLAAAGYQFGQNGYAYGEVISKTIDTSGFNAAGDLITAIYHRFVIFEPMFKEAGAGAATSASGYTYFTTDFVANGLDRGIGTGKYVVYPFANQTNIPNIFYSDNELPDPVPNRNAVGFPISIHADILATVTVQSFTVQPRGGSPLAVQLLTHAADPETPSGAAAIIPLDVLASGTIYDVMFIGTVGGVAVTRSWSFTTR